MKIMISYQVDTVAEAKAIMEAIETQVEGAKLSTFRVQDKPAAVLSAAEEDDILSRQLNNTYVEPDDSHSSGAQFDRPNVSPGAPTITKIGSNTKQYLLCDLAAGHTQPARYAEHLKLLWSRGEIKFDGKEYYL